MLKKSYRCNRCGGTPDLHSIRISVIRVYNVNSGYWRDYTIHGFEIGDRS